MKFTEHTNFTIKDKVLIQDFENESIILNIETGKYFEINELGKIIISLIKANECSINKIVHELKSQYNHEDIDKDVRDFIKRLLDLKILEAS